MLLAFSITITTDLLMSLSRLNLPKDLNILRSLNSYFSVRPNKTK